VVAREEVSGGRGATRTKGCEWKREGCGAVEVREKRNKKREKLIRGNVKGK
jgi:hypothetical protein